MKTQKKSFWKWTLVSMMCATPFMAGAQEAKSPFSVGTDLVSSYVWRGVKQDINAPIQSPNIQPYLSFSKGSLTVGAWGSTSLTASVKEFDLYATYAFSDKLALTLTDYNWNFSQSYFKYSKGTDHVYEATLAYTGGESLPLTASINTMFYGADKTSSGDQAYSTYLELGYSVCSNAKLTLGGSLFDSSVYSGSGVTNVSLKVTKEIPLTDKFSLPVYGVGGFNPLAKDAFLVFGVTL